MRKTASALLLAACLSSLTSCTAAGSKPGVLPDVQEYSCQDQKAAAEELRRYGAKMPVVAGKMMPDYGVMRKQTRAAKKILQK